MSNEQGQHGKATAEGPFQWQDALRLDLQLSEEERLVSEAARNFCNERLLPRVRDMHRHETFDPGLMREFGELGFLGCTIPEQYGGAGLNYVS